MITSKQRAFLREMANSIDPIFQVGKGGIGDALKKQVFDALEARELIKISVLPNSDLTAKEVCQELCQAVGANPVQVIGNRMVLYKRSREHKKIVLPGEPKPKVKPGQNKAKQRQNGASPSEQPKGKPKRHTLPQEEQPKSKKYTPSEQKGHRQYKPDSKRPGRRGQK